MRGAAWAGVAVGTVVAVLSGCGGDGDGEAQRAASPTAQVTTASPAPVSTASPPPYSPPPPPPVSATPPDPPTNAEAGLPDDVFDFRGVCAGTTFPGAARYAGAGPHPIEFSDVTKNAPDGMYDLDAPDAVLARWETKDVRKVQLVACVTMSRGAPARRCGYIGKPDVTMYWRDYRIVVREARTGRQVGATTRLRGEVTKCAEIVLANPDGSLDSQFSSVSAAQLRRVFTSYHSGRAR